MKHAATGDEVTVKWLLSRVVDVDVSGDSGRRVHVFRCDKRHTSIVKLNDQDSTTPSLRSATQRVVVAVQLLIDHGAAAAGKVSIQHMWIKTLVCNYPQSTDTREQKPRTKPAPTIKRSTH